MKKRLGILMAVLLLVVSGCAPAEVPPSPTVTQPAPSDTPPPAPTDTLAPATETGVPPTAVPAAFALSSSAFEADSAIPARHACHGENLSPALSWSQPPEGTQSFVLVMDDPDAVSVAGFVWDHWVLFNIPAELTSLPESMPRDAQLPDGSRNGVNSFGQPGYDGPCPPPGQTHDYVFTLYAVDSVLDLEPGATKDEILAAIDGHVLAQAELVGPYTSP